MYFCMLEETTKGVKLHVIPTRGSGLSCYQVMVNYPGVCLLASTTLRHSNQGIELLKKLIMKSPQSSYLRPCMLFHIICLLSL